MHIRYKGMELFWTQPKTQLQTKPQMSATGGARKSQTLAARASLLAESECREACCESRNEIILLTLEPDPRISRHVQAK